MTKADFTNRTRRLQREAIGLSLGWLGLWAVVVLMLVGGNGGTWLREHPVAGFSLLLAGVALFHVPIWFVAKHLHRKHGLVCPACGVWLTAQRSVEMTGQCAKCQAAVIQEVSPGRQG